MKNMDIEELLRWTYRDELPKMAAPTSMVAAVRSSWAAITRYGALMTTVQEPDIVNRWGLVPLAMAGDDPHPDALAVADAVEALAGCEVEMPDGWDPLSDMGDLGQEGADAVRRGFERLAPVVGRDGRRVVRNRLPRLIIRHAVLGSAPDWQAEPPVRRMVCGPNGKPGWFRRLTEVGQGAFGPVAITFEVDGYNHARRRPFTDAYRKFELAPDPVSVVVERGEYELWYAGLAHLVDVLDGVLMQHQATSCARSPRPWEAPDVAARILPSLLASPPPAPRSARRRVPA